MKRSIHEATPTQVRQGLDDLPREERLAVMLVCVEGLSYREAAAQLCLSVEELRNFLLRGRLALMRSLETREDRFSRPAPARPRGSLRIGGMSDGSATDAS